MKLVCSPSRRREPALPTLLFLLFGGALLAVSAFARDTILPGESMSGNQTLVSENGVFELGFFSPGPGLYHFLGVRFKNMTTSPRFWVGDRIFITDLPGAALEDIGSSLYIKEDGYSLWWSSVAEDAAPPATAMAILLDTGNLVVRDQANSSRILWQSFDHPADSMLPGARLGFIRETGDNIVLTYNNSWYNGSIRVDESRRNGFMLTIDGHHLPGTFPDWMVSSQDNGSSLVLNHPERPNVIEFLELQLGQVTLKRWSEGSSANTSGWVPRWTFPSDCKSGGFFCGTFGVCTNNGKCYCIDGFEPKYPDDWNHGYFVAGCSRSLPLSCETNGQTEHDDSFIPFYKLQGLPYNPQNDLAESDEDCREACLSECYCVAYAYDSGCKLWYHNLYNVSLASKPPYNKVYVRLGSKLRAKTRLHRRSIVILVAVFIAVQKAVAFDYDWMASSLKPSGSDVSVSRSVTPMERGQGSCCQLRQLRPWRWCCAAAVSYDVGR
ncbi:hypothetical protein EJB05_56788, partial [Eragrostis curvula]